MATEALNQRRYPWTGTMRSRLAVVNAVAFTLGTAASMMAGAGAAKGFIAGYAIGMASLLWLLRIASTGLKMPPERAGRYVAVRYYARFVLTAGVFIILIKNGLLNPWSPVAGLSACIFATVGALVISAREEAG